MHLSKYTSHYNQITNNLNASGKVNRPVEVNSRVSFQPFLNVNCNVSCSLEGIFILHIMEKGCRRNVKVTVF